MTKFVFAFTNLALVAAFAGNPTAKVPVAHVTLNKPAIINGTALKAGDYRLTLEAGKVTFLIDKRSEEHTSELQSLRHLVCRLLLEKKKIHKVEGHRADSSALGSIASPGGGAG